MARLLVGYARCSTDTQDLTAQRDALIALGVKTNRIYVDRGLTGTNRARPGLREALAACRSDTGDVRADLFTVLRIAADRLAGPYGEAARGLITETLADPNATRTAREHLGSERIRLITAVLLRAVQRGQAGPQALTPQLISLAPTLVSHHYLLHGAPISDDTINEILDYIVMPLIRPTAT